MTSPTPAKSKLSLRLAAVAAGLAGLAIGLMTWQQVEREFAQGLDDLERRSRTLTHRLVPDVQRALDDPAADALSALTPKLEGHRRLLGFAVYRAPGQVAASADGLGEFLPAFDQAVARAFSSGEENFTHVQVEDLRIAGMAVPVRTPQGSLSAVALALHDASYLDERVTQGLVRSAFWILVLTSVLLATVSGLTWLTFERPLGRLTDWMKRLRLENAPEAPPRGLPTPALVSESDRLAASLRAARSSALALSRETVRSDKRWTSDRLSAHAVACLEGDQLVVVSNREPYVHQMREGAVRVLVPASGVVTALDPVLQACGGVWIAHGSGDADRRTADAHGRLTVPPGDARYTLRRVWLSQAVEQGYYYGFSNEGMWPLCHLAHERPIFRESDWKRYTEANRLFAEAVLDEIGSGSACVLVQDYHLALVPRLVKAAHPDARVGLFWHIPWPNAEAFRICPWKAEIVEGMLGADLIGFHLQQHCNNFLETVDRVIETRLDWDVFAVDLKDHRTLVRPFPISVQDWSERHVPQGEALARQIAALRVEHGLGEEMIVAVGVDRIDYTKGIPERLRAVERFLERNPRYRERFTFVQLGAPSRTHIPRYHHLISEVEGLADEINWKFQTERWKPIRMLVEHHEGPAVHAFLSMASVCIVSSLHDGMNLVAKEYVSAQRDGNGMLVLSDFAGAAHDLPEAIRINPYAIDEFAEAIRAAVEMPAEERRARMVRMRASLEERNVYWWAAELLSSLARKKVKAPAGEAASVPP
jgi:trehalose 6-phosphate synthase